MSTNVQVTGQTIEHPSYINSTKKKKTHQEWGRPIWSNNERAPRHVVT